ncbi:hypothetical protein V494_03421 [Pseudogymnoascus sp. VKM F-4513 (FW-928)]|nr:hypothetical protein V494_03421 [Pseudogymnoascus sp. VKM F-4513 (FW-928)]
MISFNPLSVKAVLLLTAAVGVIANPVLKGRAASCDVVKCAAGTACEVIDGVAKCIGGGQCGTTVCGAGLECCNALCNICTKPGVACVQGCPVTGVATGPVCGSNTCAADEFLALKKRAAQSVVQRLVQQTRYAATHLWIFAPSLAKFASLAPTPQLQLQPAPSVAQTLALLMRYAVMRVAAHAPNPEGPAPKKRVARSAVQTPAHSARYAATRAAENAPNPACHAHRKAASAPSADQTLAYSARCAATIAVVTAPSQADNALRNSAPRLLRLAQLAALTSAHPDRYAATAAAGSAQLRAGSAPNNSVSAVASDIITAEIAGQAWPTERKEALFTTRNRMKMPKHRNTPRESKRLSEYGLLVLVDNHAPTWARGTYML